MSFPHTCVHVWGARCLVLTNIDAHVHAHVYALPPQLIIDVMWSGFETVEALSGLLSSQLRSRCFGSLFVMLLLVAD